MADQLMLGVDFGTTSCKSVLVNENGRVIRSVSRDAFLEYNVRIDNFLSGKI